MKVLSRVKKFDKIKYLVLINDFISIPFGAE